MYIQLLEKILPTAELFIMSVTDGNEGTTNLEANRIKGVEEILWIVDKLKAGASMKSKKTENCIKITQFLIILKTE